MSMTYGVTSDLTDEEAYLLAILQDHAGLDLAEFCWWDGSADDGCFRAWPFQFSWWRSRAPKQIDQCVAGGQLVLTDRGHVPIEHITVGTNVLTHKGRWRPVTAVFDRGVRPVVEVRGQGHPGLVVTADHSIYARRSRRASRPKDGHTGKKLLEPEWLAPAQWEWNDDSGKMHANWGTPATIDATELPPQLQGAYRSGQQNFVADLWTEAWMWLYGLYIAEGSSYIDAPGKGLVHRSVWSVNHTELTEVADWMTKAGLNWSSTRKGEVEPVHVNSKPVTLWLIEHAGKLAPNKRLATWVFGLPEFLRRAVFDGLTFGDGHWRNGRWSYTTVSRALAIEIRLLGLSLGETVSIYKPKHHPEQTIQGRAVKCHQKYVVDFQPSLGQRRRHMQTIDGTAWAPVKRVADYGFAHVYDLEVAEDHSFVVEGIAVHNCGRSIGKSLSIKARMFAFPFRHPGQEAVITAPELIHLEPIINLIEDQFFSTRLGREMLQKGRSAVTHRPFMLLCRNGSRLMGRIPQRDGKGVKGLHPLQLELDEAQDYPRRGWTELNATVKTGFEGAEWRAHGVTRGVRDKFYEYTQDKPGNPWKVHRFTAMHRPTWTDQERQDAIAQYGGHREDPDYRRNVLGMHGDATNPLFVVTRLYTCVDDDESSDYNLHEYCHLELSDMQINDLGPGGDPTDLLIFPDSHRDYEATWCGMDVGFCVDDQTEILTQRGWLRYDELKVGDQSLAIDPLTGCSNWETVTDIFREYRAAVPMVLMSGQTFSSLSTPNHRWLVKHETKSGHKWRWKTTESLNRKDRIPLTVPRGDAPTEAVYADEFVELAAWYWTEGEDLGAGVRIGQSIHANPDKVERIKTALEKLFGEAGPISYGPNIEWAIYEQALTMIAEGRSNYYITNRLGVSADALMRWRSGGIRVQNSWNITERHDGTMAYFYLAAHIAEPLRAVVQTAEKIVSPFFLAKLTLHQLDLFVRTSVDGDGWRDRHGSKIEQHSEARIRTFEMACALLGQGTSTLSPNGRPRWHMNLLTADNVGPVAAASFPRLTAQAMTITPVIYQGVIWCPKLKNGNWLARRNGSVYFTGNTHDPSEILVFGEYQPKPEERKQMSNRKKGCPKPGVSRFKLLTRLSLRRVPNMTQVRLILGVLAFYKPKAFGLDKTGVGLPLFQDLLAIIREEGEFSAEAQAAAEIIKGYNFAAKVIVDIDDTVEVEESEDQIREAGIHRNVLEQSTDVLRSYVDQERLWLPWDDQLIAEYEGQTFSYSKSAIDQFGRARRVFSEGRFHALDASRMFAMAHSQQSIEAIVNAKNENEAVIDRFYQPGM